MPSAQQIWWARVRVLVMSLVAGTILTVLFYLFTGGTLLQPKATVYLYIPDATGVGKGSPVRLDGIDIGKVSQVQFSGSKQPARVVRVSMRVERSHLANIPVDSTADLVTDTLLGDKFIGIRSGSSVDHLREGGEIALKPETNALDLQQFAQELRQVDTMLRDVENGTSPLGQFVKGDLFYRDLLRGVKDIDSALGGLEKTTSQIGAMLYTDQTLQAIETPLLALDQALARIQSGQGPLGEMLRDSQQYDSLRAAFADLRKTVSDFRSSEMVQSDSMYRQWNRTLEALIQQVDDMNASPLFSSSAAYDNLNGFAKEMQAGIREFREDPRKFLRLKVF
jgi:phospholipid/cholesterol/gamma-HCH transport system substrate-binding protein